MEFGLRMLTCWNQKCKVRFYMQTEGDTVRQANALEELQRILSEIEMLKLNDSFLSGHEYLMHAKNFLVSARHSWERELNNLRAEI